MEILVAVVGGAAFITWLVAVVSWFMALGHLAEGLTVGQMLFNGFRAFDPDSYTESGRPHHRRFLIASGVFLLLLFGAVGLSAATGAFAN